MVLKKMINKVIKQFAINPNLQQKSQLYAKYVDYDTSRICYVLSDETDVVICNKESVESYKDAGFKVFGVANSKVELDILIDKAEHS